MDALHLKKQQEQHRHYLWAYYSLIVIGLWLMTGFSPMGYAQKSMMINDIVCGAVLVVTDEVLASVQFIGRRRKQGHSLWKTFWFGGPGDAGSIREYTDPGNVQFRKMLSSLWEDLTIKPWTLFLSIALGLWFMASPGVFGYTGGLADSNHLVGALIVSISIIAMSEVVRISRLLNIICGLWLIAGPWIFGNPGGAVLWTQLAAASLLILVTFRKGIIKDDHGGYNRYIC